MKPIVSVVMPAYNAQNYIEDAICSVLNQTYDNLELIVVDDFSKDHTLEIIRQLALRDQRIIVVENKENHGVAYSRNIGMKLSKGKYIALLDSDDLWKTDKLEKQIKLIEKTNADIIYTSYSLVNENHTIKHSDFIVKEKTDLKKMLIRNEIGCSTVLFKSELAQKYQFKEDFYHEDYVLWLQILQDGYQAKGIQESLVDYRVMKGTRSSDKLHSAKKRWDIYRKYLNFSFIKSVCLFAGYTFEGMKKYFI